MSRPSVLVFARDVLPKDFFENVRLVQGFHCSETGGSSSESSETFGQFVVVGKRPFVRAYGYEDVRHSVLFDGVQHVGQLPFPVSWTERFAVESTGG